MLAVCAILCAVGAQARVLAAETLPLLRLAELQRAVHDANLTERIDRVSESFLGVPYLLDPAGEGPESSIDRDPVVRIDVFDCQTYVETVLAVALAESPTNVEAQLLALRYRNGEKSFGERLHFPEVDWLPAHVARGVLRDISAQVAGEYALAEAHTRITRAAWLRAIPNNPTQARNDHLRQSPEALAELERLAQGATSVRATTRYIPKTALADRQVLDRIPHGSLVMIVRPMTSMFGNVGSRQNISHMGFAIRKHNGLAYRHASSTRHKAVVDRQMDEYLAAMGQSRTFAGVVVFQVVESRN